MTMLTYTFQQVLEQYMYFRVVKVTFSICDYTVPNLIPCVRKVNHQNQLNKDKYKGTNEPNIHPC